MPDSRELRARYEATFGYWDDRWEALLEVDAPLFAAYLDLVSVPMRKGHLDPVSRALIFLAVDVASTHLYLPGVRQRIAHALDLGATRAQIAEVFRLVATLGIHAMNLGVPMLAELLVERGDRTGPAELTAYQEELKERFTVARGYWHAFWDEMLELDPEMFEAYTDFSSLPWADSVLEPKLKEFVYTAFDSSATHLYVEGWRLHMRNALGYGATPGELLEVMEISSTLGIHGPLSAAPILRDELQKRLGRTEPRVG